MTSPSSIITLLFFKKLNKFDFVKYLSLPTIAKKASYVENNLEFFILPEIWSNSFTKFISLKINSFKFAAISGVTPLLLLDELAIEHTLFFKDGFFLGTIRPKNSFKLSEKSLSLSKL